MNSLTLRLHLLNKLLFSNFMYHNEIPFTFPLPKTCSHQFSNLTYSTTLAIQAGHYNCPQINQPVYLCFQVKWTEMAISPNSAHWENSHSSLSFRAPEQSTSKQFISNFPKTLIMKGLGKRDNFFTISHLVLGIPEDIRVDFKHNTTRRVYLMGWWYNLFAHKMYLCLWGPFIISYIS